MCLQRTHNDVLGSWDCCSEIFSKVVFKKSNIIRELSSKIIGIIVMQKQQAKCWHNRSKFKQSTFGKLQ